MNQRPEMIRKTVTTKTGCIDCPKGLKALISTKLGRCAACMRLSLTGAIAGGVALFLTTGNYQVDILFFIGSAFFTLLWFAHVIAFIRYSSHTLGSQGNSANNVALLSVLSETAKKFAESIRISVVGKFPEQLKNPKRSTPSPLLFGPVEGFTTASHPVPKEFVLPVGIPIKFQARYLAHGEKVIWKGEGLAEDNGTEAIFQFKKAGKIELGFKVFPGDDWYTYPITTANIYPKDLNIEYGIFRVPKSERDDDLLELVQEGNMLQTQVRETLRLKARSKTRNHIPELNLAGLSEWQLDGSPIGVAETDVWLLRQGTRCLTVGPDKHVVNLNSYP